VYHFQIPHFLSTAFLAENSRFFAIFSLKNSLNLVKILKKPVQKIVSNSVFEFFLDFNSSIIAAQIATCIQIAEPPAKTHMEGTYTS
jgi:hypothetical protein